MSSISQLPVELLIPLHAPTHRNLLGDLISSMKADGWLGRPLLVIQRGEKFFAWTGSHRIEAARRAGLNSVPCYVVDGDSLTRLGLDVDAEFGHVQDYERLSIIRRTGDEGAIHLMWQEGRN